jgi:hypothetical protein
MWTGIQRRRGPFLDAVRDRDVPAVQRALAGMFQSELIWGLGRVHPETADHIRTGDHSGVQIQIADALVSLAEATGAARLTCIEQQGVDVHLAALQVDLDALLAKVVDRTGIDVDMPAAGGNYGCTIAGRHVSIDSLVHAYTAFRLRQLRVRSRARIVEIGGGYGCLARVCRRSGFDDFTVVDLPWVNILQGYLLVMTLPAGDVSLFGEPDRPVKVRPFWEFAAMRARSVDVVINTDSLPEIGEESGRRYIGDIARVMRGCFLSINQESMVEYPGLGRQLHVNSLAAGNRHLRLAHRHRYWMRQGYVEELFVPAYGRLRETAWWSARRIARFLGLVGMLLLIASGCSRKDAIHDSGNELPFGQIDTPVENALVKAVTPVAGWALDDVGIREVRIYVDGRFNGLAKPQAERPDVKRSFPQYVRPRLRPGWAGSVTFDQPGEHTILAQAVDLDGATRDIGTVHVTAVDR